LPNASQPRVNPPVDRAARIRPGSAAAAFGALVGLAIGCAYLGGTAAKANVVRAQAERIEGATAAGFTEEALAAAAGGLDESALAIARRHDPYTVAGGAQRDRQAELMTARLEQLRAQPGDASLRRVNLTGQVAALPFRLGSTLDASRDLDCLTKAAYYEARGEGRDGMRAVVQVVLNRVRHSAFPNSVCGVVFQGQSGGLEPRPRRRLRRPVRNRLRQCRNRDPFPHHRRLARLAPFAGPGRPGRRPPVLPLRRPLRVARSLLLRRPPLDRR